MREPGLSPGRIALRIVAVSALVAGCCMQTSTCMLPPEGYERDEDHSSGDFDLYVSDEGGCLPDIRPELPVQLITIYKIKESEDQVAAVAFCTDDRDMIELFEYWGSNGCSLELVQDYFPDEDDAATGDGGLVDAGASTELCYCVVGEQWKVGSHEETAYCEGSFRIVAETVDGSTATYVYEQAYEDPREEEDEQSDPGSCCCAAVGR
jgi:hypothetical protein